MPSSDWGVRWLVAPRFWFGAGLTAAILFVVAAVVVPRTEGIARFDENLMAMMPNVRRPWLTTLAQIVTDLGAYIQVTLISAVLAIALGYRARRLLEPVMMVAAVWMSTRLVELLKLATDRVRPPAEGVVGAPVFDYSFPSGHTASGTVLYLLGASLLAARAPRTASRRLLVAAGCIMGGLIGLSRVYLGYHWFTDVLGAWLLALILTSIGMVLALRVGAPTLPQPLVARSPMVGWSPWGVSAWLPGRTDPPAPRRTPISADGSTPHRVSRQLTTREG